MSAHSADWRSISRHLLPRLALPLAWALVIVFFGALEPSTFLTTANFQGIFGSQAVLVVVALALVVPLTAGDYDLSVTAILTLSAMVVAVLDVQHGWPVGFAAIAGVVVGAIAGFVNAAIVVLLEAESLVTTLGTGSVISGIVLWISDSNTIGGVSNGLVDPVTTWKLLGIPLAFYYAVVLCAILWYALEYTAPGRRLLFVGRGREVSRLSGIRVGRVRWGAFVISGSVSGLAGVLYAGTTGAADPSSGASFLLPAFAAAFLGAISIVPGRFNPWGTFVAVYFLVTGVTGLQLLGAESFVQQLFYGGALIFAVALARLAGRSLANG